jgi:glycosyltransferase involved in cell wall biosynthesis
MNLVVLDSARPQVLGGIERALADLAARARARGHDARAAGRRGSRFSAHCRELGIPTLELALRSALDPGSVVRLGRLFRGHRTDAVLGATTRDARLAGLARVGRPGRRPRVALLVGLPMMRETWSHRLTYRFFVDALLVPTAWQRAQVQRYPFVRSLPCEVLPDGVDEGLFPPLAGLAGARRAARSEAGVRPGQAVLLSVGHLVERKNLMFVPPLLRRLPPGADWEWWVVGDGAQETRLRAAVADLGLDRQVKFLGPREDVPRLLLSADALVMPSRAEQLPLAALEARRAGVPQVLVAAVGAVEEMRALGIQTLPPGDAEAWLEALRATAGAPGGCRPAGSWDRDAGRTAGLRLEFLERLAGCGAEPAARPATAEACR